MDETPISYLALEVGTLVQTSSGKTIGTVEHVLQIPEESFFDGIVVATDQGLRFVDRDQILQITRSVVHCETDRRRSCKHFLHHKEHEDSTSIPSRTSGTLSTPASVGCSAGSDGSRTSSYVERSSEARIRPFSPISGTRRAHDWSR